MTEGINPDVEIGRFLTEKTSFAHVPKLAGYLELRKERAAGPATLGIMQAVVPNEGDAWRYTLDRLGHYFEDILTRQLDVRQAILPAESLFEQTTKETPALAQELIGAYLPSARRLGQRTAELHLALASDASDPDFAPEPFTALYRRSVYQSMRTLMDSSFKLLERRLKSLPPDVRPEAERVLAQEDNVISRLHQIVDRKLGGMRIRCHGDYHLGQVLYTGKDFIIIDFEGEPARPISERRAKRSALRDVAGMIRSFDYAAVAALGDRIVRPDDAAQLRPWAKFWYRFVSTEFLEGFLATIGNAPFMPRSADEINLLLNIFLLEKAVYEIGYELNNRPAWVNVPIAGVLDLLQTDGKEPAVRNRDS